MQSTIHSAHGSYFASAIARKKATLVDSGTVPRRQIVSEVSIMYEGRREHVILVRTLAAHFC